MYTLKYLRPLIITNHFFYYYLYSGGKNNRTENKHIIWNRVGRCLPNWHRTMSTVKHCDGRWHRGAGLGACPKRECVCREVRKTNNTFYGATKAAVLNSSPRVPPLSIFCMSLFVWLRSLARSWTEFQLTCSLHRVHCSLLPEQGRSVEVYFTSDHSFTDLRCAATCSVFIHRRNLLEKREVWHNIPL